MPQLQCLDACVCPCIFFLATPFPLHPFLAKTQTPKTLKPLNPKPYLGVWVFAYMMHVFIPGLATHPPCPACHPPQVSHYLGEPAVAFGSFLQGGCLRCHVLDIVLGGQEGTCCTLYNLLYSVQCTPNLSRCHA